MIIDKKQQTAIWFFGRGTSIACNLTWTEPLEWRTLFREIRINEIKKTLLKKMQEPSVDVKPYKDLCYILGKFTKEGSKHLFITTNWDFLLQQELLKVIKIKYLPSWLISSHVFHLNGSVEPGSQKNRSQLLLETDPYNVRKSTIEANQAVAHMIWAKLFIVVGVSFSCEIDKSLLLFLRLHEDNLPFGEGKWLILDPNKQALDNTCLCLRKVLPRTDIIPIKEGFQEWLDDGLPELAKYGVF